MALVLVNLLSIASVITILHHDTVDLLLPHAQVPGAIRDLVGLLFGLEFGIRVHLYIK